MADETVIRSRGLEVRYGDVTAVKGVDVEVRAGEVVGLIGPDGAGKTSTLRVLAGLLPASAGETTVLGRPVWGQRRRLHRRLGYLAQRFALYGDLTVDENIQFFALLYGVRDWRTRRDQLLRRVSLEPFRSRQAERLSGGMKQKLALACTLIHSPVMLLLDEPTTGVDPVTRRELWRLLGALVADGLTLVVATPYLDEAERCTRVILMHHGRVLADAPPAEIRGRLPGRLVELAAGPRDAVRRALASVPQVVDVSVFGASFHVRLEDVDDPTAVVAQALSRAGIAPSGLREVQAELEDTFLYLTSGGSDETAGEAA